MIKNFVGNISQCAGITDSQVTGGKAKGLRLLELYNAAGLRATIMPDKCLDMLNFSYKGVNFSFITKNGMSSNHNYGFSQDEFTHTWSAGMLSTCGLSNIGNPNVDETGEFHTLHGRIHLQAAENLCINSDYCKDDFVLEISGTMRESALAGKNFTLKRKISTSLYSKEIKFEDVVTNHDTKPQKFAILYHSNFGYPLLNEGARIVKPKGELTARTPNATKVISDWATMTSPIDNIDEYVFFHENKADKDGFTYAAVINDALGLGGYIKYSYNTLPVLAEWKNMKSQDYALGLEPANAHFEGRKNEKYNVLEPGASEKFTLVYGVLDGKDEIKKFEDMVSSL